MKLRPVVFFLLLSGLCPHMSVPVEMDESMTPSSLDLAFFPSCKQCQEDEETSRGPQEHDCEEEERAAPAVSQGRPPGSQPLHAAPTPHLIPPALVGNLKPPNPAEVWLGGQRDQPVLYEQDFIEKHRMGFSYSSYQPQVPSVEPESLEPPFPLISDANSTNYIPVRQHPVGQHQAGRYPVAQLPAAQHPAGRYPSPQHFPARHPAAHLPGQCYTSLQT